MFKQCHVKCPVLTKLVLSARLFTLYSSVYAVFVMLQLCVQRQRTECVQLWTQHAVLVATSISRQPSSVASTLHKYVVMTWYTVYLLLCPELCSLSYSEAYDVSGVRPREAERFTLALPVHAPCDNTSHAELSRLVLETATDATRNVTCFGEGSCRLSSEVSPCELVTSRRKRHAPLRTPEVTVKVSVIYNETARRGTS